MCIIPMLENKHRRIKSTKQQKERLCTRLLYGGQMKWNEIKGNKNFVSIQIRCNRSTASNICVFINSIYRIFFKWFHFSLLLSLFTSVWSIRLMADKHYHFMHRCHLTEHFKTNKKNEKNEKRRQYLHINICL